MSGEGPTLRDIHLPGDPSWWPPAPGWWILATIVLMAMAYAAYRLVRAARRRRWRRAVVGELDAIVRRHADSRDGARLAGDLSELLRRGARLVDPDASALRGEAWLGFLDAQLGSDAFTRGIGRTLLDAPFRREAAFDADALLALCRRWLARVAERESAHA